MLLRISSYIAVYLLLQICLMSGCGKESNVKTTAEAERSEEPVEVSAADATPEPHYPWLPDELRGVSLGDFDPEQVKAVQSWFPVEVKGWPAWEALDLSLHPVRRRVVRFHGGGGIIQILGLYVRGNSPPLTQEEKKTIIRVADNIVHATEGVEIKRSEEEYNIQQVWLYRFNKRIDVKSSSATDTFQLRLRPQNLDEFRAIVRRVNQALGDDRLTRIYIDFHPGVWLSQPAGPPPRG